MTMEFYLVQRRWWHGNVIQDDCDDETGIIFSAKAIMTREFHSPPQTWGYTYAHILFSDFRFSFLLTLRTNVFCDGNLPFTAICRHNIFFLLQSVNHSSVLKWKRKQIKYIVSTWFCHFRILALRIFYFCFLINYADMLSLLCAKFYAQSISGSVSKYCTITE